jgi:hypothetical protein
VERRLRPAAILLALVAGACTTGVPSSGETGDTGDDAPSTTSGGPALPCGEAEHSVLVDGTCYCEVGTTWAEPFNPMSFACAPLEPREGECDPEHGAGQEGACTCADCHRFCAFDNLGDTSCCFDEAQLDCVAPTPETTTSDASTGAGGTDSSSSGSGGSSDSTG